MRAKDSRIAEEHGGVVEMEDRHKGRNTDAHALPLKEGVFTVQDVDSDRSADIEDLTTTPEGSKSTQNDLQGMRRMGKDQQFVRNFRFVSITAFVAIATASWEIGLFIITPGLVDGGRAGLIWSVLWSFIGFAPIWLSMAEMASMAPIAGKRLCV